MTRGQSHRRPSPTTGYDNRVLLSIVVLGLVFGAGCRSAESGDDNASDGTGAVADGDVYQVIPRSCIGDIHIRATAMAVTGDLVATAAHSFDGAVGARLLDGDGEEVEADIVYADFDRDIALLRVAGGNRTVFSGSDADDNQPITVIGYTDVETGPGTESGTVIRTAVVTLDGAGRRRAIELDVDIDRGDSGGPVVDDDGRAVGMVFAASRDGGQGWAVTFDELTDAVDEFSDGAVLSLPTRCR